MRVLEITDKQGVQDTLREVKETLKIEKNPPVITRAEGWSPFAARKFLEEYDLTTEDYHRTMGLVNKQSFNKYKKYVFS